MSSNSVKDALHYSIKILQNLSLDFKGFRAAMVKIIHKTAFELLKQELFAGKTKTTTTTKAVLCTSRNQILCPCKASYWISTPR